MSSLLVLVLDNIEKFPALIDAWEEAGVPGITVLDSVGTRRLHEHLQRDDVPLLPSLRSLFARDEDHNRTLLTVIEEPVVLERAIASAEEIVGDFMESHTGIMFVLPVPRTWGVPKAPRGRKLNSPTPSDESM